MKICLGKDVAKPSKYILITRMCWPFTHTMLGIITVVEQISMRGLELCMQRKGKHKNVFYIFFKNGVS